MPAQARLEFPPRYPIAGILVSSVTYESATRAVVAAASAGRSAVIAATSVHGLTLGVRDPAFGRQLNTFEMLTPDGQPVRWGLNLLHGLGLQRRVYGPQLMLDVCVAAARERLPIYLYGGRQETLERLVRRLPELAPGLEIAGYRSPPFRRLTTDEEADDVRNIVTSGARVLFVGLGCPRQERWAFAHRNQLPMPIVCVGAAFDFHAGTLRQAPPWMQARGLEWLFRLIVEPRRLWRRYAIIVPFYCFLLGREFARSRLRRLHSAPPA
jgi:N-acetylglucosaminyldiphosphoundecaprenol N-acetyl-beta-D-mannosaminyltransferase